MPVPCGKVPRERSVCMTTLNDKTNPLKLAWPIFIETLLFMVMGNIDTLMLSRFSDNAVAAVGNANQILNTLLIFFSITSSATGIMVAQYLGAHNRKALKQVYLLAFATNLILAGVISLLVLNARMGLLSAARVPVELYGDTLAYLNVTMRFLFVPALFVVASVILKSNGQTKLTMILAIGMNLVNVAGNYAALFGPFGLPILGVKGVAIATVVSRGMALVVLLVVLTRYYDVSFNLKHLVPFPKTVFKKFLHIGLPSAGEPMSWQLSQMVIFVFINTMGKTVITTKIYVQIIVWFSYLGCMAIAQGNQIVVGYLVGAGKENRAEALTKKSLKQSMAITVFFSLLIALMGSRLLKLFTDNPEIIALGATLLYIDVFVEMGRVLNLVLIFAVKAAGDVFYPVKIGIVSMWLVSTLLAYLLGIGLGWGLIGIWVAMGADELLRGALMWRRFRSGQWKGKKVVSD